MHYSRGSTRCSLAELLNRDETHLTFDEKVWVLTTRIPRGRVASYGEIARRLGTRAYRAVGNALNRNPYAPDVPCHRVVGSDGSLGGFAGGLGKKKSLLEAEGLQIMKGKVDRKMMIHVS